MNLAAQLQLWRAAEQVLQRSAEAPALGTGGERYELAVQLDAGATSSVWQAYDHKLGRDVAIKFYRDDRATLDHVLAEARAASDVPSDHVVRILDVHDDATGPYIVMELVGERAPEHGELVLGSAASTCRPESLAEAVRWTIAVARGVHDAHSRNVFHRDLKPKNVLIMPLSRRARIADFGLAVSAASASDGVRATIRGTPEYMAPEQARGLPALDPRIVEERARLVAIDVWGLGALAYDLLAGRPPWGAAGDLDAWERAASGARPLALPRAIPRRLRRIVERALALDPRARYPSAAALAAELEAFAARRPTSFDRGRTARATLWCRRNPQLAIAGLVAAALVALTLGTRATVTRLRGERDALDEAVAAQHRELERLTRNVRQIRAELARAKRALAEEGQDLAALEARLAEERRARAAAAAALRDKQDEIEALESALSVRETAIVREATAESRDRSERPTRAEGASH